VIKAVVFDLDGVYFDKGKKNFVNNISEKFKVNKELFWDFFINSDLMIKYKKGKISKNQFWSKTIEKFHIKSTPDELLRILKEGYEICPKTVRLVRRLRKVGIKTIICSDNFKERIEVLQERFNFLNDFDLVVLSYAYGMLKPALLRKIVKASSFKPEELVVIDDNKKTIEEAKRNGFKAILCENPEKIGIKLKQFGVL